MSISVANDISLACGLTPVRLTLVSPSEPFFANACCHIIKDAIKAYERKVLVAEVGPDEIPRIGPKRHFKYHKGPQKGAFV
jgi:hypothetical protein